MAHLPLLPMRLHWSSIAAQFFERFTVEGPGRAQLPQIQLESLHNAEALAEQLRAAYAQLDVEFELDANTRSVLDVSLNEAQWQDLVTGWVSKPSRDLESLFEEKCKYGGNTRIYAVLDHLHKNSSAVYIELQWQVPRNKLTKKTVTDFLNGLPAVQQHMMALALVSASSGERMRRYRIPYLLEQYKLVRDEGPSGDTSAGNVERGA